LSHCKRLLDQKSEAKNCEIVGIDGKGFSHKVMLAAVSPFLKELLQSIPPYIDGCVILPDIQKRDIGQFLESLSYPGQTFTVSETLANLLRLAPMVMKVAKEEIIEDEDDPEDYFPLFENNEDEELPCENGSDPVNSDKKIKKKKRIAEVECPYCVKKFTTETRLKGHMRRNHKKQYQANNKDASIKLEASRGINEDSESVDTFDGDYKCDICQRYFSTKERRDLHNVKFHNMPDLDPNYEVVEDMYQCKFCVKQCEKRENIKKHLREKHKVGAKFKCEFCNKLFSFNNTLQKHKRAHTQEKDFFCEECGEGFVYKEKLLRHKRNVHLPKEEKEKLKKEMCQICGFSCYFKSKLKVHMEIHNSKKMFSCEFCGKAYRTSKGLGAHRTQHKNADKPRKVKSDYEHAVEAARSRRYRAIKAGKIEPHEFLPGDEQFVFATYKPKQKNYDSDDQDKNEPELLSGTTSPKPIVQQHLTVNPAANSSAMQLPSHYQQMALARMKTLVGSGVYSSQEQSQMYKE